MTKSKCLLAILASLTLFTLVSCGSSPKDETVINTIEANHITVNVTKSNVKITLSKLEGDDFDSITVTEKNYGNISRVQMTDPQVTFEWPFAEAGKEYTLIAGFTNKGSYQEETVSFKVENEMQSVLHFDDSSEANISLIAKSAQRIIQVETPYSEVVKPFEKAKLKNPELYLSIYSGKHYKASEKDSTLVISKKFDYSNKAALDPYTKGYDIISNAAAFNITPAELNKRLSSKLTYFAAITVNFALENTPEGITFTSNPIYSNDTIYTPVAEKELPESLSAADAK